MNVKDLQDKTVEQLREELLTQVQSQFKLRMQAATGQLNQTHLLKLARKDIARIKTVLNQKAGA